MLENEEKLKKFLDNYSWLKKENSSLKKTFE